MYMFSSINNMFMGLQSKHSKVILSFTLPWGEGVRLVREAHGLVPRVRAGPVLAARALQGRRQVHRRPVAERHGREGPLVRNVEQLATAEEE